MSLRFQKRIWPKSPTVFLKTTHPKMSKIVFMACYTVKQVISTWMDVSSSHLSKQLPPTSDVLLLWERKRSRKFVRYFEILTVAAVQSNALLLAFSRKFKLKRNLPIRPRYSKYSLLIGGGTDLCPAGNFCSF